jgi:hypothetical protein
MRPQRLRFVPSIITGSSLIPILVLTNRLAPRSCRLERWFSNLRNLHSKKRLLSPSHLDKQRAFFSKWKEFYTSARAIHNKGLCGGDLDLFNNSHTTLNAIDETFKRIEKRESYNFPEDGNLTVQAACDALSHALLEASLAKVEHDTPEVKQALDNLRRAYNEAAESNTISMRYIDLEPPYAPFSPLMPPDSDPPKQIILARSWVKELVTEIHKQFLGRRILIVGNPGSGESLGLPSICIANI